MLVTSYHAFTDEKDEYTATLEQAKSIINEWRDEGYVNLRIYELTSDDTLDDEVNEDCIFSEGNYPW